MEKAKTLASVRKLIERLIERTNAGDDGPVLILFRNGTYAVVRRISNKGVVVGDEEVLPWDTPIRGVGSSASEFTDITF